MLAKRTVLTSAFLAMMFISANVYAKYYQVTDNTTGKIYYTKDIDRKDNGAIKFKDARTGSKVTLQSTSVLKIEKDEFKSGLKSCPSPVLEYREPLPETNIRVSPPEPGTEQNIHIDRIDTD